jgi:hypothetical protein
MFCMCCAVYKTVLLHVQCVLKRSCMAAMQTSLVNVSSTLKNTFARTQSQLFVATCFVVRRGRAMKRWADVCASRMVHAVLQDS